MMALIYAGGVPKRPDPLHAYTDGMTKALLPIGGQPMVQWELEAIEATPTVNRVVVVGLLAGCRLDARGPVQHLADEGSLLANAQAGLNWVRSRSQGNPHALLTATDIPTITPEIAP